MGFLSSIFGGAEEPAPPPPMEEVKEQRDDIDPNIEDRNRAATKRRRQMAPTGRSDLKTSRKYSPVSIVGKS